MSSKAFIVSVSLAVSAAALACWIFAGETAGVTPSGGPSNTARPTPGRTAVKSSPASNTARADKSATVAPQSRVSQARQPPVPAQPLTAEELSARAARVEQEANHDLR